MRPRPPNALPELFLTFLAPSIRPSLSRLSTSRRTLSTLKQLQKDCEHDFERTRSFKRLGKAAKGGTRALSGLATSHATERTEPEVYAPVASTSAVRLDSPFPTSSHTAAPPTSFEATPTDCPASLVDDAERSLGDLPVVLRRLRSLSVSYPTESPSEIISRARSQAFDDERNRSPPTPPPPIVLHPQPYSSNTQFFTPLLLQAMILGASALGLLTRRKVRHTDSSTGQDSRRMVKSAREQAEERIDEVQALNLLISAHAVPDTLELDVPTALDWRTEMLRPLVNLVAQAVKSDRPLNRLGVASILHYAGSASPSSMKHREARPLLAMRAYEAYQSLPSVERESPHFPLDISILSSFLSLIYPRPSPSAAKFFPASGRSSGLDRSVLESVAHRVSSSPSDFPPELVFELGSAAARAKRLDLFVGVLSMRHHLSVSLQLDLAVTGLDLVASQQSWRNDRERVTPFAELFASTVERSGPLDKAGLDRLDRGIYLLRTAFSVDRPLEPFIARAVISTLSYPSNFDNKRYCTVLTDVLKHLSKSRNPSLARRILLSIPSEHLRISYLSSLLSSSHAPTSQFAWDLLLSHPSLPLTESAVSHRFTSLSHRSALPPTLEVARRDFQVVRTRGITPTVEIWNKFLHVVVRFGTDRAVARAVSAMERAGIEPNEWTRTIRLQREMIRRDEQVRRVVRDDYAGTTCEDDEWERPRRSERPIDQVLRVKRRGGGQAQMRKVREAMRENERRRLGVTTTTTTTTRPSLTIDVTPNLVLKNFTRWTTECDTNRLVQLTKIVVGVELEGGTGLGVPPSQPTSCEARRSPSTETNVEVSIKEFEKVRAPAFRTLMSAFERRGRTDLAQELRRVFRAEREEVKELNRSRRRA